MRVTSQTTSDGVFEQLFLLGDIPGALWTPGGADGTCPLIVMGHGGGQHKKAPSIVDRARRFVAECGFAVVAVDAPSHGDRPDHAEFTRIATEYGYDRDDPGSWAEKRVHLSARSHVDARTFAPAAWRSVMELVPSR
jgi:poly(3-hydroxybutyrate) depolymerase